MLLSIFTETFYGHYYVTIIMDLDCKLNYCRTKCFPRIFALDNDHPAWVLRIAFPYLAGGDMLLFFLVIRFWR